MTLVRRAVTIAAAVVDPASLTDAERRFVDQMRDVALVGSFTVAGREDRGPKADRYAGTWSG